jgi:hypothetical protein
MAKGSRQRVPTPKRGKGIKKRTSEFITPVAHSDDDDDDDDDDDVDVDVDVDVVNPATRKVAAVASVDSVPKRKISRFDNRKKPPTTITVLPTTQVFDNPNASVPNPNMEDNTSPLEDAVFRQPSVSLTNALAIHDENLTLELQNQLSLQNRTIIALQNTNRDLLSDRKQVAQFSKWHTFISKVVAKIFHTAKFANLNVSSL